MQIAMDRQDIDLVSGLLVEQQLRVMDLARDSIERMDVDELVRLADQLKGLRRLQEIMKDKGQVAETVKPEPKPAPRPEPKKAEKPEPEQDGAPYLAWSGKGRKPSKCCGKCRMFRNGHCINGDKVTENHVCAMFELDKNEPGFGRKFG